jgi:transposase
MRSLDFAIKVAIDKYRDHIPLARQERILRGHGLIVTTQTLWDQLLAVGHRLESASRALLARGGRPQGGAPALGPRAVA